jgi:hypothetical protein
MSYYILLFAIIVSIYIYGENKRHVFFLLPIIALILEIGKGLSGILFDATGYNGFMFFIIFIFIMRFFFLIKENKNPKSNNIFLQAIFIILILYLLFRLDISLDNIFNIISRFGSFVLILFMFFVGYRWINSMQRLYLLNHYFIITVIIYVTLTIFFSLMRMGPTAYQGGFIMGATQFQLYFAVLPIVLALLLIVLNKAKNNIYRTKSYYLKFIICLSMIIVMLSLMRTTWVMSIAGLIVFLIFIKKNRWSRRVIFSIVSLFAIMVIFVMNSNILEVRESRFNENYELEDEGRMVEFQMVNEHLFDQESLMFGEGNLFNAKGLYGFDRYERPLHGTYTNIFFGAGYVGLALIVLFFLTILLSYLKIRTKNRLVNIMKVTGISLVLGQMIAFFSGNTTYGYGISYFILSFLYAGALLRLSIIYKNKNEVYISNPSQKRIG